MLSDQNEKYSDRMERSYKAFAVTFELRFPFPLMTSMVVAEYILGSQVSAHLFRGSSWSSVMSVVYVIVS